MRIKSQIFYLTISAYFLVFSLAGCGGDSADDLSANIVPSEHFNEFLVRDLRSYFNLPARSPKSVGQEFIKGNEDAVKSSNGLPRYYLWVFVYEGNKVVSEGFAEVDSVSKTRFTVRTFISKDAIKKDPRAIEEAYGTSLGADIIDRANRH
ncbi:hypothetical protein BH11CYA1_BH11CYA1_44890 [soil metagenome]